MTTDLSITFCAPLEADGSELRSASLTVFADERSAISDGEVVNSRGELVAKAITRVVFTPDQAISGAEVQPGSIDRSRDVMTLLGGWWFHDDDALLDVGRLSLNPAGALHGGVSAYMSERAASSTVDAQIGDLRPTVLQISYIRPGREGSRLTFRCVPTHVGRNSAVVRVESRTRDDKLCTVASMSYHRR